MYRPPEERDVRAFEQRGYLCIPGFVTGTTLEALQQGAREGLTQGAPPFEYEADVHYPGSPPSRSASGGGTVRRLLQACARDPRFRAFATAPTVRAWVEALLGTRHPVLVQAHHNCVMTKQPEFSSDTGWHQDVRYWNYERPDLLNIWLALTEEHPQNGCLRLLPETHRWPIPEAWLTASQFLRSDLPETKAWIARQEVARLLPGDVLFFHARTFHAADRNRTEDPKLSLVFTYKDSQNRPLPDTRSGQIPEIDLGSTFKD